LRVRDEYPKLLCGVSEIDFARLAAFIDGEGSVYINCPGGKNSRYKIQHRLSIIISNTNPILMNWLKSTFDGSVYHVKYENCKHLGKKPIMRWQMNERMAAHLLERVLPYMMLKKGQAEIGLAFIRLKQPKIPGIASTKLTDEDFRQRDVMKMEIQRLNKEIPELLTIN
jgi:hypothetical protein